MKHLTEIPRTSRTPPAPSPRGSRRRRHCATCRTHGSSIHSSSSKTKSTVSAAGRQRAGAGDLARITGLTTTGSSNTRKSGRPTSLSGVSATAVESSSTWRPSATLSGSGMVHHPASCRGCVIEGLWCLPPAWGGAARSSRTNCGRGIGCGGEARADAMVLPTACRRQRRTRQIGTER